MKNLYAPPPSVEEELEQALQGYLDDRRYGGAFPWSGGLEEQPAAWKEQMDCVKSAEEEARNQRDLDRAELDESASGAGDAAEVPGEDYLMD